jgi:hypothetical protein
VSSLLCILMLPGRRGLTIWTVGEMSHGWPFAFAEREVGWEYANPWIITDRLVEFSWWGLLVDLTLAAFAMWATFRWLRGRARTRAPGQPIWLSIFPWRLSWLVLVIAPLCAGWSMQQRRLERMDTWEAAAWSQMAYRFGDQMGLVVFLAIAALGLGLASTRRWTARQRLPDPPRFASLWSVLLALGIAGATACWVLWRVQTSQRAPLSMAVDLALFAVLVPILMAGARGWRAWRARRAPRPKLQFSLRTLLVATLLCAVALVYGVDYYRQEECRRHLDQQLESSLIPHAFRPLAYLVSLWRGPEPYSWHRPRFGMVAAEAPSSAVQVNSLRYMIQAYPQQTALYMSQRLTDDQVQYLPKVSHVRSVVLLEGDDRNDALLARFTNVRYLFFKQSEPRLLSRREPYDFLAHVRHMSGLRKLFVFGEHVDDDELGHLAGMSELDELHITWAPHTFWLWGTAEYWPTPDHVYPHHDGRPGTAVEEPITDRGLAHLSHMRSLMRLNLEGTRVTGPGLDHLHKLPRLRHLSLEGAALTDQGLAHVNGCRQLVSLDLSCTPLATLGALDWERLPYLRRLVLTGTDVSEKRLGELRRQHPRVEIVHEFYDQIHAAEANSQARSCNAHRHVNNEMLERVGRASEVRYLSLSCTDITDEDLRHIAGMTQLTGLGLSRTRISNLEHLRNLTALDRLNLDGTAIADLEPLTRLIGLQELWLTDVPVHSETVQALSRMEDLHYLALTNTPLTDAGLAHVAGLSQLDKLLLSGTQVSDAGLVHLACLTKLTELQLHRTRVSGTGLAHLAGLTELNSLTLDSLVVDNGAAAELATWPELPTIYLHHPQLEVAEQAANKLRASLPGFMVYGMTWE